jgi:hypothetical protein
MSNRCATLPYLRLIGYDREWIGVSPSSAGNGPRYLYLKAIVDYAINPQDRVWAAFGTSTHDKLGMHKYIHNVLSEERLSDAEACGFADVLELDENREGYFILTDYKTWGSYKVAKALGITQVDEEVRDESGSPILLKSGKNKGKPKTHKKTIIDPSTIDLKSEILQLNRYRIFFESYSFPVSRMQIQAIPRDGGTYIAQGRGIDKNLYLIDVPFMPDSECLDYYRDLQGEVDTAFETGFVRKCNDFESWQGRRCNGYCEVSEACKKMEEGK